MFYKFAADNLTKNEGSETIPLVAVRSEIKITNVHEYIGVALWKKYTFNQNFEHYQLHFFTTNQRWIANIIL